MSFTHTRSDLIALSQGPTPRLPVAIFIHLGKLSLLSRMKTSRSRRKKEKRKSEKQPSGTEAELSLINARDLRTFSTGSKVSRLLAK
jgi:hypothetical protein